MIAKKKALVPVLALAAVAAGVAGYLRRHAVDPPGIRFSGNIEATDAEVSFRIPGRLVRRLASEGEPVRAGQVVGELDASDLANELGIRHAEVQAVEAALAELLAGSRPEEVRQAVAAADLARARLDELRSGARPQEVAAAEAAVGRDRADLERLRSEADRQARLFEGGLISARENEAAGAAYRMAEEKYRESGERAKLVREGPRQEKIRQAQAALAEASERLALVRKGPRREAIAQARARLAQAREALALAETRLAYATAVSPLSGVVASENAEAGEYVAPGTPVVTVADLSKVWLRAYVQESELGRVKVGQSVRVTTDSYPEKTYEGRISFLANQAEFTPKAVQTEKERVKLVYRIKVDLPNPTLELKPGMPADGVVVPGGAQ